MLSPFAAKANHWPLYFQTQCSDGMFCSVQTGPPTGAWRGRVLAFVERNELLGFPAFHSQCSRATERLARRLCGSLGGAALVNTDVVASATQPADAGPVPLVPRRGQWPLLVLPSHPKKEYALLKNNVLKLMACAISGDAIVRFVSLPRCQGLVSRPIVKSKKVEAGISEERFCDVWHVCRLVDR